jgi:hypothetical protein
MTKRKKKPISLAQPMTRTTTVENPDWRPDRDGEKAFPRMITAQIDVKESAVEALYQRRFLAMSQKLAADRFRELWEAAGGKTSSIDYTLDRVDGGKGDPVTSRLRAIQELRRCRQLLGQRGYETLESVCGEGKALTEITCAKRERYTAADNLRADLDDLATMWGMQSKQRQRA